MNPNKYAFGVSSMHSEYQLGNFLILWFMGGEVRPVKEPSRQLMRQFLKPTRPSCNLESAKITLSEDLFQIYR